MREAHQRAEVDVVVLGVADADAFDALKDFRFEGSFQGARHEHASTVGADLTRAVEVGHHRDVGGAIQIGVVENDQRGLAAQLHGHFLERRA